MMSNNCYPILQDGKLRQIQLNKVSYVGGVRDGIRMWGSFLNVAYFSASHLIQTPLLGYFTEKPT